jgi:F0F1-type ATP synthase membrane subunit c/vacuolar-type H+-ATPase subunit K
LSILTADRYTSSSISSFVARINSVSSVGNTFSFIVANPNAGDADNLFVSTLVGFGLVAAVALLGLVVQ